MNSENLKHDQLAIRCRKLGHEVTFKYCRTLEGQTICPSIHNCWWERFDIDSWLKENISKKQYNELTNKKPTPKLNKIMEIIHSIKD